jgi:sec-independent protein translocase protein TatB
VLNLDPAKLLVIAVVAVILLGPDKLPQVARQVGAAWRTLNDFRHKMESEVRSSIPDLPSSAEIARLARSPSALLNHLSNMDANGDATSVAPTSAAPTSVTPTSADGLGDESSLVTGVPITPSAPVPPTSISRPPTSAHPPTPTSSRPPTPPDPSLN